MASVAIGTRVTVETYLGVVRRLTAEAAKKGTHARTVSDLMRELLTGWMAREGRDDEPAGEEVDIAEVMRMGGGLPAPPADLFQADPNA